MFEDLKGRPTAQKWDTLITRLENKLRIRGGPGILVQSTPAGDVISAMKSKTAVGGPAASCTNFAFSFNGTDIDISTGQVGAVIVAATTKPVGSSIYVEVSMDGTTGALSAEIATAASNTATKKTILLGSSDSDGKVSQVACGPFNAVACRNWFAAEAPYFTLQIEF